MELRQLIDGLSLESESLCIVAKRPWSATSEARLVALTDDYRIPSEVLVQGYEYFLEVSLVLDEILHGMEGILSPDQRFDAVLYYAENDAYPEWLKSMASRQGGGDA